MLANFFDNNAKFVTKIRSIRWNPTLFAFA